MKKVLKIAAIITLFLILGLLALIKALSEIDPCTCIGIEGKYGRCYGVPTPCTGLHQTDCQTDEDGNTICFP